jgi:ankyrin repeat protein
MNLLDTFFNSCRCHDYDMIKNLSKTIDINEFSVCDKLKDIEWLSHFFNKDTKEKFIKNYISISSTVLWLSAFEYNIKVVQLLIDCGANQNISSESINNSTPLM